MPQAIPHPTMVYTGSEANRDAADRFVEQIAVNPAAMVIALSTIVETPPGTEVKADYATVAEEKRAARLAALEAALGFLSIGRDSGNFDFDRPTERAIANDKKLGELLRLHRASDRNSTRQAEITERIRARRLGIYTSRWVRANATIAQTYRQVVY